MFVIFILNLFVIVTLGSKCSFTEKVQCTAAAAGCSTKCISDFPESAKYEDCVACVSVITSNCCKCVFPNWTGCDYAKSLNIIPKVTEDVKLASTKSRWTFIITIMGILMVFLIFIMNPTESVNSRLLKLLCVFIIWWLLLAYFV